MHRRSAPAMDGEAKRKGKFHGTKDLRRARLDDPVGEDFLVLLRRLRQAADTWKRGVKAEPGLRSDFRGVCWEFLVVIAGSSSGPWPRRRRIDRSAAWRRRWCSPGAL